MTKIKTGASKDAPVLPSSKALDRAAGMMYNRLIKPRSRQNERGSIMKRTLTFFLALTMLLSLCACGKKPAPGVVEVTPDNWYAYFDVIKTDPEVTSDDGEYRSENYYYAFRLKDEYASEILDPSDEETQKTYDFESLEKGPWSGVDFKVTYDSLWGQCNADGDIIPVLADKESQNTQASYYPDSADDPYAGSFAYMNTNYENDALSYVNVLTGFTVTEASGQLIMSPEAAEAAIAAAGTAQPPVLDTYADPGEPTEVPLTLDNWQDYFEIRDRVREDKNAFGEVDYVSQQYELVLKDEYFMKVAPGSDAIFQITYTQTSPDGYAYNDDWDGEIDFSYMDSDTGSFSTYITSSGMQTDEAEQYITDEAGNYIPYYTYALTMARVGGSLFLYN